MARKVWFGQVPGSEGDFAESENWFPAGAPAGGDEVVFRDSTQDVTAGLGTLSGETSGTLLVESTYTGKIGSPADPMLFGADLAVVAGGEVWLDVEDAGGRNVRQIGGTLGLAGDLDYVVYAGGQLFAGFDGAPSGLIAIADLVAHNEWPTQNLVSLPVAIGSPNCTASVATVRQISGLSVLSLINGTAARVDLAAGEFITLGGSVTNLWQFGGVFRLNEDGTHGTHRVHGGVYYATANAIAKTVNTLLLYGKPVVNISNAAINQTFSNIEIFGRPTLNFDPMTEIAL